MRTWYDCNLRISLARTRLLRKIIENRGPNRVTEHSTKNDDASSLGILDDTIVETFIRPRCELGSSDNHGSRPIAQRGCEVCFCRLRIVYFGVLARFLSSVRSFSYISSKNSSLSIARRRICGLTASADIT